MIYFIFASIFLLFFLLETYRGVKKTTAYKICVVLTVLLFCFRGTNVGGDTYAYVDFFTGKGSFYGTMSENNLEYGFNLFARILSCFSSSPFFFIFASALVSLMPFFLIVKKYGTSYSLPFLYILCFISFTVCLQTNLRQDIAVGFFLLAGYILVSTFHSEVQKKKIIYGLCTLLFIWGVIGHNTMWVVGPVLIGLWFLRFYKKFSIALMIGSFVLSTITTVYFENLFQVVNNYMAQTELFEHYSTYGANGFYELSGNTTALNFFNISLTLWPVLNIMACDDKEQNNIFMKCMVVNCVIYNISCSFPIAFRMVYIFQYLSLCYVPKQILWNRKYFWLNMILIVSFLRVLLNTSLNPALQNADSHMFPYNFIFE